jgi:hypothetical protein
MDYLELTIALSRQCSCIIESVASTHDLAMQRRSQAARGGDEEIAKTFLYGAQLPAVIWRATIF